MSTKKWTWVVVAVAVALLATFTVSAGKLGLTPITGPGWSGWCGLCSQDEVQTFEVRNEGGMDCLYVVWYADANQNGRMDGAEVALHPSLAYCIKPSRTGRLGVTK